MADFTHDAAAEREPLRLGQMVQYAGAAVSLALVVGIGIWGYRMVMRDVSGIPVVKAMEGPMRVAPTDPGGEVAPHLGLSVNAIAAEGGTAPPEDRLVLAPPQTGLTPEDLAAQPLDGNDAVARAEAEAGPTPSSPAPPVVPATQPERQTLTEEQIKALADEIAAAAATAPGDAAAPAATQTGPVIIPASVPGVARSLRPLERPQGLAPGAVAVEAAASGLSAAAARQTPPGLTTTPIPAGTVLVQLGAFPSVEVAGHEWLRIAAGAPDYMTGKDPVILEAGTGARTFYRLRAKGFADMGDARRFCAAMNLDPTQCIPVMVH
ncbi:MAG: SPOR domain-containing protein [Limimaricola sp.]|uniref:SPOR domain-containing protein n=1 Tax=Limimaricola sp. TaxID=2211665 RepID=UPI001D2B2EA7|nr:SPOR domain-containing protein [Limimaricola sp.]MBI1418321.1 SPOR domain-containing protein [Limimaricola sp.]